jgi:hypothetical protein
MKKGMLALVMLALSWGVLADSRQTVLFGKAGEWSIYVDRTVGNGCFAIGHFEAGTVVRVGWAPSANRFYMIYSDQRWADNLELGANYTLRFAFDDGAVSYGGTLKAVNLAGQKALFHDRVDPEFMLDFGRRGTLTVYNARGGRMAKLNLESSQQALDEVVRCQREMNG